MKSRYFTNSTGFTAGNPNNPAIAIEWREDGRRFCHYRDGTTYQFDGIDNGDQAKNGRYIYHCLEAIENRIASGVWLELTYEQVFSSHKPQTQSEMVW